MIWAWGYLWGRCLIINLFSRYSDFPVDFISYGKLCFSVSLSIFFKVFEFIGLRLLLLFSCVWLFEIPWAAACQASLSLTISWSLFKLKEFTFHNILYYIFNVCRSFSDSAFFIITLLTCSFSLSSRSVLLEFKTIVFFFSRKLYFFHLIEVYCLQLFKVES